MKKAPSSSHDTKVHITKHIDLMDQAADCCANISTLGKLLSVSGHQISEGWVEAEIIVQAGRMIMLEAEKLNGLLRMRTATFQKRNHRINA